MGEKTENLSCLQEKNIEKLMVKNYIYYNAACF